MALRVLLADESVSIKKVMQLALQDFAVEVKAVPVGLDVLTVTKSWNPDIIFIDILLSKRNGYEVCFDLKKDPSTKNIPAVLMWSGFMEIDEEKAQGCGANERIEKPFDADTLRRIVKELVPRTQSNIISNFITFPDLPDFIEKQSSQNKSSPPQRPLQNEETAFRPVDYPPTYEPLNLDQEEESQSLAQPGQEFLQLDVDEPEEFTQVPLPKVTDKKPIASEKENWSSGQLNKFKLNIPKDDFSLDEYPQDLEDASIALSNEGSVSIQDLEEMGSQNPSRTQPKLNHQRINQIDLSNLDVKSLVDPAHLEQILKDQIKQVVQDIAWKIMPDITERIVKEELQRLLKEAEKI